MLHRKENSTPINAKNADTCGLNNMKKRTGLALAGGILEIIAAAFWLSYALFALYIFAQVENGLQLFDWLQIIFPVCFIVYGILAIIGTMKSELISFGVTNLLFMGWLIYKACAGNAAVSQLILIILLFSTEFILLILSSCFFFFSKESEYEIVFDEKYKQYMSAQPPKFKKIKKIYIISCVAMTFLICLAPILGGIISFIFIGLFVLGFIVLSIIISKRNNNSKYKLKSNIIFSSLAIFLIALLSIGQAVSIYRASETIKWVDFGREVKYTYIYYDFDFENYYLLTGWGKNGTYEGEITYTSANGKSFSEVPENAMEVSIRYSCRYSCDSVWITKTYYKFFDPNSNSIKYYYIQNENVDGGTESQIVDNIPETETIYFHTINWGTVVLVGIVSFLICAAVILCTYNFQFKQDVKKMLKEEENKKIVEKYSAEIPQRIVLQPNPVTPQPKQDVERTTEEKESQKGEESKSNVEKNSSETPIRIVLPPRPPMPPTSKK